MQSLLVSDWTQSPKPASAWSDSPYLIETVGSCGLLWPEHQDTKCWSWGSRSTSRKRNRKQIGIVPTPNVMDYSSQQSQGWFSPVSSFWRWRDKGPESSGWWPYEPFKKRGCITSGSWAHKAPIQQKFHVCCCFKLELVANIKKLGGSVWQFLNRGLPYGSAIPLLGIYLWNSK